MLCIDSGGVGVSLTEFLDIFKNMYNKTEIENIAKFTELKIPDEYTDALSFRFVESCTPLVINEEKEVEDIILTARNCNFYYLNDLNHAKNNVFSCNYYMNDRQIRDIFESIEAKDYCYSVKYKKSKESEDIYHVFTPDIWLLNRDTYELVHLYIKLKFIYNVNGEREMVIVACHKRMFNPKRPFR